MAGEDPDYMAWLRTQQCQSPVPCVHLSGPPHHSTNGSTYSPEDGPRGKQLPGRRGKSQTAHDHCAFALCLQHHDQFHDERGVFRDWTKVERHEWQDREVAKARAAYAAFREQNPLPAPAKKERVRTAQGGPATASDALTQAWVAGANAERARIAEWLENSSGNPMCSAEGHAVLQDHAQVLRERLEPMARLR